MRFVWTNERFQLVAISIFLAKSFTQSGNCRSVVRIKYLLFSSPQAFIETFMQKDVLSSLLTFSDRLLPNVHTNTLMKEVIVNSTLCL